MIKIFTTIELFNEDNFECDDSDLGDWTNPDFDDYSWDNPLALNGNGRRDLGGSECTEGCLVGLPVEGVTEVTIVKIKLVCRIIIVKVCPSNIPTPSPTPSGTPFWNRLLGAPARLRH